MCSSKPVIKMWSFSRVSCVAIFFVWPQTEEIGLEIITTTKISTNFRGSPRNFETDFHGRKWESPDYTVKPYNLEILIFEVWSPPWAMYLCIYMYIHTCIYIYIHIYIYTHIHVYIYKYDIYKSDLLRERRVASWLWRHSRPHCNTLQHTATHCNTTLQHTAAHRNTLQHTAEHCNTMQQTATLLRHSCSTPEIYFPVLLEFFFLYRKKSAL